MNITNPLRESDYIPFLLNMARKVETPFAESVIKSIENGEKPNLSVNPLSYADPSTYFLDAQVAAFFSKNPHFTCGIDTKAAALDAWEMAEARNTITNDFFRKSLKSPRFGLSWQILYSAKHFVSEILKEVVLGDGRFGPGSSTMLKGKRANLICKLGTLPDVSHSAHDYVLKFILEHMPHYAISSGIVKRERHSVSLAVRHLPIQDFDVLRFVPKNFKTDRPISIGPTGNMLVQLAIGAGIRSRLKAYGLDLNSAPDRHSWWACKSSRDGSLATIDLASASDTISLEFVRFMLPAEWFDLLYSVRMHKTQLPNGSVRRLEKFSAMGNGYTFELESLLFYAILLACRKLCGSPDQIVSTYGDDIICSTDLATVVIETLNFAGFTVNQDKTFTSGPFRESCGNDYFNGYSVRPVYFKDAFNDRKPIETLFYMANRIFEVHDCISFGYVHSGLFDAFRKNILKRVPQYFQYYGPYIYGDQVITSSSSFGGYRLSRKIRKWRLPTEPDWRNTCALAGIDSTGLSPRGSDFLLRKCKSYRLGLSSLWLHSIDYSYRIKCEVVDSKMSEEKVENIIRKLIK